MGIGRRPPMRWTAKYSTNVFPGHEANRKPDLALFTDGTHGDWRCIRSVGEMKSHRSWSVGFAGLQDQVSVKSAIMFAAQDNRNFVIAIGFAKYDMVVYKFDRGGLEQCEPFSITDPVGWKYFARVIYCLGYGDMECLGYDGSAQVEPQPNGLRYMAMQCPKFANMNLDYKIEGQLHLTETLFGRGSNVRRVCHRGTNTQYIVKDTWHNVARHLTEGQILHVIRDIPNIPKIKEYVVDEDQFSSTFHSRFKVVGDEQVYTALHNGLFQDRVHLRLLMEAMPIQLISNFKTRAELAQALVGCAVAHSNAFSEFGILHHDIHLGNMYIKNSDGSGQTGGVLGDWGFAECQDISKVKACLEHIDYAHPTAALTAPTPATITAHSPSSIAPSLTLPPSFPEPSQPRLHTRGTEWTRATGMILREYRESSVTDLDSDLDTKKPSAIPSPNELRLNPWPRRAKIELAERMGNASCLSIRTMVRSASDQHGGHKICDDLESFFYVIIIMLTFEAPGQCKGDEELQQLNLDDLWWKPKPKDWATCVKWKLATMKLDALWFDNIANNFSPYFDCWKGPIDDMRNKIFLHYNMGVHDLNRMCNMDGVKHSDILDILNMMVQVGIKADEADAKAGVEQGSFADTKITSDIAPTHDDDLTSLFSLEVIDNSPDADDLNLTSATPASYTHSERLDIASSLTAMVATSDISEGAAFPPFVGHMPSRDVILQHALHVFAPQTLDTGELPSALSEVTPCKASTLDHDELEGGEASVVTTLATEGSKWSRSGVPTNSRRKGNDDDGGDDDECLPPQKS
ncbi:hypothetical protein AZE42_04423, partial [Rhizopogon vesiculosus]